MKTVISILASVVIAGLVIGGAMLFLGLDWGAEQSKKEAQSAAAAAIQAMSYTQELHEKLGTPFTQGEVSVQSSNLQMMGTSSMQLTVQVSGPKGAGKASCSLTKLRGEPFWTLTNGMFFPTAGPPVAIKARSAGSSLPGPR